MDVLPPACDQLTLLPAPFPAVRYTSGSLQCWNDSSGTDYPRGLNAVAAPTPTQAVPAAVTHLPTPQCMTPSPASSSLYQPRLFPSPPSFQSQEQASLPTHHPLSQPCQPLTPIPTSLCPSPGMPCAGVPARQTRCPVPAFTSYPCPSAHTPPRLLMLVPLSQPFIQHWGPSAETLSFELEPSALHYCSAEEKTSLQPKGTIFFPESRCITNLRSPRVVRPLLPAHARTSGKVSSQPDFSISVRNDVFATKRKKPHNSGIFSCKTPCNCNAEF